MSDTPLKKLLKLAGKTGILRARDAEQNGIARTYLKMAVARGLLTRVGRGLYTLAEAEATEQRSLVEVVKRVPDGVVCLLSALQFHGLTTQSPSEVWLAIGEKARKPKAEYPPLRIVRFSGKAQTEGVAEQEIEGVTVRVTNPAKTVADCFKYRNKIGLDVALEALRDCRRKRKATADELWRYAKVCRVTNVMRPYLEAVA
jgi:predicted transcriptional regulator of viral defense system